MNDCFCVSTLIPEKNIEDAVILNWKTLMNHFDHRLMNKLLSTN